MLGALLLTAVAAVSVAKVQGARSLDPSEVQLDNGVLASLPLVKRSGDSLRLENWAGATRPAKNINRVSGTVTVPSWRGRKDDNWVSGMYMGVRLDGLPPCRKESPNVYIWQAVAPAEAQDPISQFRGSWRWGTYTGGSENVLSFPIAAGDQVRMELEVLPNGASVNGTLTNLRTGQVVYRVMDDANGVCGYTANWVLGIYSSSSKPKPLTDFLDPVTFSDISAATSSGELLTLDGAQAMDIEEPWRENPLRGGLQTDCAIVDNTTVTCNRLWPELPTSV